MKKKGMPFKVLIMIAILLAGPVFAEGKNLKWRSYLLPEGWEISPLMIQRWKESDRQ